MSRAPNSKTATPSSSSSSKSNAFRPGNTAAPLTDRAAASRPAPAFRPERGSDLQEWLEGKFREALALIPRAAEQPSFGKVLQRIE
jgi:hypothetical protein